MKRHTNIEETHNEVLEFLKTKKGTEVEDYFDFPNKYGDNVSTYYVKYNIKDEFNYYSKEIKIHHSTPQLFISNLGYFPYETLSDIKDIIESQTPLKN